MHPYVYMYIHMHITLNVLCETLAHSIDWVVPPSDKGNVEENFKIFRTK